MEKSISVIIARAGELHMRMSVDENIVLAFDVLIGDYDELRRVTLFRVEKDSCRLEARCVSDPIGAWKRVWRE
jgi:hypothetical protein